MDYDIEEWIFYIFTDGASRTVFNEKIKRKTWRHWWKWVWFVYYDKKYKLIEEDKSDFISYTKATNQDMELRACVDGLELVINEDLSHFKKVMIVTDSKFIYENWGNAYFWHRERRWRRTIYGDPVVHKEKRKELVKYMRNIYQIHWKNVDFDLVKWHKDNEYNNKADKSAVKWAQSKIRVLGNNSEVRKKIFKKTTWFKNWYLPVQWQEILIHIYSSRYLRKGGFRYNYEVVSWNSDFFMNANWIFYNKTVLSAEFIYLVKMKNDGSNQIEEIISTHTKDEIRIRMISEGIDKEIFYGKLQSN